MEAGPLLRNAGLEPSFELDPVRHCPYCHTDYRGWPCPNADEDNVCRATTPWVAP